jgi:hypothetical protein
LPVQPSIKDLKMGEYHGVITLDNMEAVRVIIPEAVQLQSHLSHSNLLANTPYLMAGHKFMSDLHKPKLKFKGGGQYTLTVNKGHNIINILPISTTQETNYRIIYLHLDQPYDPPTCVNETHYQQMNRANLHTPTAFIWHLQYACKSAEILKHTQRHVEGLNVQMGSWSHLKQLLPCSACLAGKMKKTKKTPKKTPTIGYTDIQNLVVSWLPGTDNKVSTPNEIVSIDWGIINKRNKANVNNIFALYLDNNTGFVFVYLAESRGQAGPSLQAFIQRCGVPKTIVHDNAQDFCAGTFAQLCADKSIQLVPTPPYDPNKNPTEKYMDILTSMTRCLLFISGLDTVLHWDHCPPGDGTTMVVP